MLRFDPSKTFEKLLTVTLTLVNESQFPNPMTWQALEKVAQDARDIALQLRRIGGLKQWEDRMTALAFKTEGEANRKVRIVVGVRVEVGVGVGVWTGIEIEIGIGICIGIGIAIGIGIRIGDTG